MFGVCSSLNRGVATTIKTKGCQRRRQPLTTIRRNATTRPRVVAVTASTAPNGKAAIVVGAGPAGALTAAHLAALGWSVDVYERRGASNKVGQSARTYNVVLNSRGLDALKYGGVKLDDELIRRSERYGASRGEDGFGVLEFGVWRERRGQQSRARGDDCSRGKGKVWRFH
jgi:hypothetical protein